jgi:trehalose 6-phosphate phosphatase
MSRPVENTAPAQVDDAAFFLDVDGTLLAIAELPEIVIPSAAVCGLLTQLVSATNGAVALVSGRPLQQIDRMFAPNRFPAAAQHGAERREPNGRIVWSESHLPALQAIEPKLRELADTDARLWLEDKGLSIALHYRRAPELGESLRVAMREMLVPHRSLRLQTGKRVLEVCSAEISKGKAVEAFMHLKPFTGRRSIYIGDDLTDESAFEWVNARGGVSIKVGPEPSAAQQRLQDPPAVFRWLTTYLEGGTHGADAGP